MSASLVSGALLFLAANVEAAGFPEWAHRQEVPVPAAGLVKLALPADTLDAAQPGLEDLRLADDAGAEVPYAIERPAPEGPLVTPVKSLQTALEGDATVVVIETGLARRLEAVMVRTAARTYLKAVQVEGSGDGKTWRLLARGAPIFRQPPGIEQREVPVTPGSWPFLRLTLDDRRSPPVPITGAEVRAAAAEASPREPVVVRIVDRSQGPGETRLTLDLGAAHLRLVALSVETPEPLFTRGVALAARQVRDHVVEDTVLAGGVIYRVAVEGHPPAAALTVPLDVVTPERELSLRIQDGDSPPLAITGVRAERRPVHIVFLARRPGGYTLFSGNPRAPAPRYDLAALAPRLAGAAVSRIGVGARRPNPGFRPVEPLAEVPVRGAPLDVSAWAYRKPVGISRAGIQTLELDLEVLARAGPRLADLRLVSEGHHVPYVLEPTSATRAIAPVVSTAADAQRPRWSRWILAFPHARIPVMRIACRSRTPLFRRDVVLSEEVTGPRGDSVRRRLGRATWARSPGREAAELGLTLVRTPETARLVLETDDGDNPPIELDDCQAFHRVPRLLYKASPGAPLHLYYGNPAAGGPRYDLRLVASEMLTADQSPAVLGVEELLRGTSWFGATPLHGRGGILLWGAMALVVIGLLVIIARLLPKGAAPP